MSQQDAQQVLTHADERISGPELKLVFDNAAKSSENLATATHEGAEMLKDAHEVERYEIKQLEAPVTKIKVVFHVALDILRHLYF